jgi:hypothetical protein
MNKENLKQLPSLVESNDKDDDIRELALDEVEAINGAANVEAVSSM